MDTNARAQTQALTESNYKHIHLPNKVHAGDNDAKEVVNIYRNRPDNTAEDVPYARLQATDSQASVDMLSVPLTRMEKRHGEREAHGG